MSASIEDKFTINFRFRREYMIELMTCLRIPAEFKMEYGHWVNGQEGMLVMLNFLAYPARFTDREEFFGWEYTRLCRIADYMKQYVYDTHRHRLQDFQWAAQYMALSKQAIQAKKLTLQRPPLLQPYPRTGKVAGYYDGFRMNVCRPGMLEVNDQNGVRVHVDIQASVYNDYVKVLIYSNAILKHEELISFVF
jgi:hypothetical protein